MVPNSATQYGGACYKCHAYMAQCGSGGQIFRKIYEISAYDASAGCKVENLDRFKNICQKIDLVL